MNQKIGEVVECAYPAWGWWDGDEDWRVHRERGGRFMDGFYGLWVVVVKIPSGNCREWKYILWTPSNQNGVEHICWTGPGHTRMYANRVATEAELISAEKAFDAVENSNRIVLM